MEREKKRKKPQISTTSQQFSQAKATSTVMIYKYSFLFSTGIPIQLPVLFPSHGWGENKTKQNRHGKVTQPGSCTAGTEGQTPVPYEERSRLGQRSARSLGQAQSTAFPNTCWKSTGALSPSSPAAQSEGFCHRMQ